MNQVCLEPPTPIAFSRCSSLTSLNSFDIKSVHSSVNSEYSMMMVVKRNETASPGGANPHADDEEDDDLDKLMPESPAAANSSFKTAQRLVHKQQQLQSRQSAILAMNGGELKTALLMDSETRTTEPPETTNAAAEVNKNPYNLHTPPVKLMPSAASQAKFNQAAPFGHGLGGSFVQQPVVMPFSSFSGQPPPQPIHANKSMPVLSSSTAASFGAGAKPFAFLKSSAPTQFNCMPPVPLASQAPPKFLANRQLNLAQSMLPPPAVAHSWQLPMMPSTSVSSSIDSEELPVDFGQCRTPRLKQGGGVAAGGSVASSHQNSPPESVCSHMSTSSVPSVIREDINSRSHHFNTYLEMINRGGGGGQARESMFPRVNGGENRGQQYFMLHTPSSSSSSQFNDTLVLAETQKSKTGLKLIDQHEENHLERHFMREESRETEEDSSVVVVPLKEEELGSERPSFLDEDEQPRTFLTEDTPNQSVLNEAKPALPRPFPLLAAKRGEDGAVVEEFGAYFSKISVSQPMQAPPVPGVFGGVEGQYRFNQKQVGVFNFPAPPIQLQPQKAESYVAYSVETSARPWSTAFQSRLDYASTAAGNPSGYLYQEQVNTPVEFASLSGASQLLEESHEIKATADDDVDAAESSVLREHGDRRSLDDSDDELILQNFIDEMLPHAIGHAGAVSSPALVQTANQVNTSLNEYEPTARTTNTPNVKISTFNLADKPPMIVKRASLNIRPSPHEPGLLANAGIRLPKRNSNGSTLELVHSTQAFLAVNNEMRGHLLADRTNRMHHATHAQQQHSQSINSANSLNLSSASNHSVGSFGNKGSGASSLENSCKLARNETKPVASKPLLYKKRLSAEAVELQAVRQNLSPSVGRKTTSKFSSSKLNKLPAAPNNNAPILRQTASNVRQALGPSKPAAHHSTSDRMNATISTQPSSSNSSHPVITMTKTAQLRANANLAKKPATTSTTTTAPRIVTTARAKPPGAATCSGTGRPGRPDLNETQSLEAKKSASEARRKSLGLDKPLLPSTHLAKPKTAPTATASRLLSAPTAKQLATARPVFKTK